MTENVPGQFALVGERGAAVHALVDPWRRSARNAGVVVEPLLRNRHWYINFLPRVWVRGGAGKKLTLVSAWGRPGVAPGGRTRTHTRDSLMRDTLNPNSTTIICDQPSHLKLLTSHRTPLWLTTYRIVRHPRVVRGTFTTWIFVIHPSSPVHFFF